MLTYFFKSRKIYIHNFQIACVYCTSFIENCIIKLYISSEMQREYFFLANIQV